MRQTSCPLCGCILAENDLVKRFWVTDGGALVDFLVGNYDGVRCQGCGYYLNDSPLVAINSFLEDRCILWADDIPPERADATGSVLKQLLESVICNPKDTIVVSERSELSRYRPGRS